MAQENKPVHKPEHGVAIFDDAVRAAAFLTFENGTLVVTLPDNTPPEPWLAERIEHIRTHELSLRTEKWDMERRVVYVSSEIVTERDPRFPAAIAEEFRRMGSLAHVTPIDIREPLFFLNRPEFSQPEREDIIGTIANIDAGTARAFHDLTALLSKTMV